MSIDRPLIMIVERFLRETGMSATQLGRDALNDPRFVADLRAGREPGRRVRCRVEHFMNIERARRSPRPAPATAMSMAADASTRTETMQ